MKKLQLNIPYTFGLWYNIKIGAINQIVKRYNMFNYEILKSFNDMEMLVYDYIMKNKNVVNT